MYFYRVLLLCNNSVSTSKYFGNIFNIKELGGLPMPSQDETTIATMLYDCLTPDERRMVRELIRELSSDQESVDGSQVAMQ